MNDTLNYYNQNADSFIQNTGSIDFHEIQDLFLSRIPEGGSILDLGCGSGRDALYFQNKGFEVEAWDGSEKMCQAARKLTGINVANKLFTDLDAVEKYDGIWACSSLLHASQKELPGIFKKITAALKPEGTFYSSFKYGEFCGTRNGRFFTDLNKESFKNLVDAIPELIMEKQWISEDVRKDHQGELWLNTIMTKK